MDAPHYYCLWWIPAGHIPTIAEGRQRLRHYQTHGATPPPSGSHNNSPHRWKRPPWFSCLAGPRA